LSVIFLVRHGETVWNAVGRQQGRLDSPLTARGVEQARAAGRALHRVVRDTAGVVVETSPLGRARQTTALICEQLGLAADAAVVSALLVEHDFGAWQGLTFAEIDARYPGARQQRDSNKWTYRVKDGESYALVGARARRWLAGAKASIIVAVTHEMTSRTIQGAYLSLSPQQTLTRSHRQGQIYRLADGAIVELPDG
jgi:broad specificity phosphatase PhoE